MQVQTAQPPPTASLPTPSKRVHFGEGAAADASAASSDQQPTAAGAAPDGGKAAGGSPSLYANGLYSPAAPQRQGSWTIEAQRSDRMELSSSALEGDGDATTPGRCGGAGEGAVVGWLAGAAATLG